MKKVCLRSKNTTVEYVNNTVIRRHNVAAWSIVDRIKTLPRNLSPVTILKLRSFTRRIRYALFMSHTEEYLNQLGKLITVLSPFPFPGLPILKEEVSLSPCGSSRPVCLYRCFTLVLSCLCLQQVSCRFPSGPHGYVFKILRYAVQKKGQIYQSTKAFAFNTDI